ncbi:MAG: hypothetical protein K2J26_01270, partial [Ruminococcus sp.]|nr:hypothetical protein [Ruminococcus sp.]
MKRLRKVSISLITSFLSFASFSIPSIYAAYEDYTEEEIAKIEADIDTYNNEINAYGDNFGYSTDRFYFPNGSYYPIYTEEDLNWQEYHKRSTNIEALTVDLDYFIGNTQAGRCLGMSITSVLAHNGIISPSDIQEGKETLLDIEADTSFNGIKKDPAMMPIISYHTRQLAPDFQLDMYYHFAHYDKEKEINHLLETAKKATEQGKWWLMGYDDVKLSHAVTGIGLVEGEFKIGDETYDKCILTYDSNFISEETETGNMISCTQCYPDSCIFVNSETYNLFVPAYFLDDCTNENFKIYTLDDYDFMNYRGMINPSDSYETDVSSLNSVEIKSQGEYSIDAIGADGSEYDAKSGCGKIFKKNKKECYVCDGNQFNVQNTGNAAEFTADFMDTRQLYCSTFNGAVNNVFKSEDEFGFDTLGETEYNITLAFEEGCYSFAPHYRYDFSGTTDGDFKAIQTDRGIIVSGKNGVECSLKTSDVERDENGFLVSAEDNVQDEGIFTSDSVMISFEGNKPKYFIGENYDKEVQKGDVNCDGMIDASDASFVLQAYSSLSTGGTTYLSHSLADWDNNGMIDASDASFILEKYAELSTT